MKRLALTPILVTAALAAHADTFVDNARVRSVQPQYESVSTPRQECSSQWVNETRRVEGERQYGGAVIGGVAGAVLGNQVGRGHGREAATALGAVLGAFTGDRVQNRDRVDQYQQVPREVTSCQTVNDVQQRLTGYQVSYEYRGQQFSALLPHNPGSNLQVRVSVDPVVTR
ncbi:MAG: glycine zipper 2TM domain-containing protein [Burkholderiaceae bacterium]|nr:glycine zipper 2TM domain-containing protein [Burkholderiaceae bacterium]